MARPKKIKEKIMSVSPVGLDVGTSFIISAKFQDDNVAYREMRDAFFRMKADSPIQASLLRKGLAGKVFYQDKDGSFIILGQDAIEKAVEKRLSAARPLARGVISPKEKDARQVLRLIWKELLGPAEAPGQKLVYSIPAQPIDQTEETFDTGFHELALGNDFRELGYDPTPLNEAEAIAFSELEDDDYTGITISAGAGMVNVCLMSNGETLTAFSMVRSGDWIDRMSAIATNEPDSIVQIEKEHGDFRVGQEVMDNRILDAVSKYYLRLIEYTVKLIEVKLSSMQLPKFSKPMPFIISGGTSRAKGFIEAFKAQLEKTPLPIEISDVRPAKDQLRAVARGCLLVASM